MKIVLATSGSRGDVQPMLALALGLREKGHDVVLAGPPERAGWAKELGCPYHPLGRDVTAFVDGFRSTQTLPAAVAFARYVREEIRGQFKALPGIVSGADLVVGASLCFGLAGVAESMEIPYRYIAFTPQLLPSACHPFPAFKHQGLPEWCNRFGWWWVLTADRFYTARMINRHRRQLGLAPVKDILRSSFGEKVIVASDPALGDMPPDAVPTAVQTGYMHLRQQARELPALERFLDGGRAPVYAGFGSMPREDQMKLVPLLVQAARSAGRRIVIARPWIEHSETATGDLFYIRQYPYELLFPRMAVIVHHGGAGTTATAAASGVPQVVVPHILDQYYWGERVSRAGIGPKAIWRKHLTERKLSSAIGRCLRDGRMRQNALSVRESIRLRKNGVEMTVEELINGTTF